MRVTKGTLTKVFELSRRESNPEVASNLVYDIITKDKATNNRKRMLYWYRHKGIAELLGMKLLKMY